MESRELTVYHHMQKWEYFFPTQIIYGLTVNQSLNLKILAPLGCFITLSIKMPVHKQHLLWQSASWLVKTMLYQDRIVQT
jgi:hypothetical protein